MTAPSAAMRAAEEIAEAMAEDMRTVGKLVRAGAMVPSAERIAAIIARHAPPADAAQMREALEAMVIDMQIVQRNARNAAVRDSRWEGYAESLQPRIDQAKAALAAGPADAPQFVFRYRNYKGDVSERHVRPIGIRFGSTEWHPMPQWLLLAFDLDKRAEREFAMRDMAGLSSPLAAGPADAVPEGWKLVPVEPTDAMIAAGWIDKEDVNPDDIYGAMLDAAPEPPR